MSCSAGVLYTNQVEDTCPRCGRALVVDRRIYMLEADRLSAEWHRVVSAALVALCGKHGVGGGNRQGEDTNE